MLIGCRLSVIRNVDQVFIIDMLRMPFRTHDPTIQSLKGRHTLKYMYVPSLCSFPRVPDVPLSLKNVILLRFPRKQLKQGFNYLSSESKNKQSNFGRSNYNNKSITTYVPSKKGPQNSGNYNYSLHMFTASLCQVSSSAVLQCI